MRTESHVTGERRKEMVKAIETILGENAVYMRMPTCAFQIGDFTVTKDGALEWPDGTDNETVGRVMAGLEEAGFTASAPAASDENIPAVLNETIPAVTAEDMSDVSTPATSEEAVEPEKATDPKEHVEDAGPVGLTVELPRSSLSDEALANLRKIIDSKASLLKKAIGTDILEIIVTDDKIAFPWFPELNENSSMAYILLIDHLCAMARNAKRVTAKEHTVESEKYAMRCFLVRLGFGGAEFKKMRSFLLKNLDGSSAFRTQADAEAFNEKLKQKRAAQKEVADAVSE